MVVEAKIQIDSQAVKAIRSAILKNRYFVARFASAEQLKEICSQKSLFSRHHLPGGEQGVAL